MDFVEENRNVEGILPVLVVRISANPHKFIALLNRGSALGLNFDVTREPEWGIAGKIPRKKEGGITWKRMFIPLQRSQPCKRGEEGMLPSQGRGLGSVLCVLDDWNSGDANT
jgi:hypothetical protein